MIKRALLIIALLPGIACAEQQNLNYTTKTDWKTEGAKVQNNFTDLYTNKAGKPYINASAPADTTLDWYDTDQEVGVYVHKKHNGTTWVRVGSHGVQYASSCASITAGMCVDAAGKLYYHNGTAVVEVGSATGAEANVNADWNSSSGDSQILNKPTETPISASIVTNLFYGTGDCLGKNGEAVDCGGAVGDLDDLTDVVITGTPTTGHVLKYNGTNWVPAADATAEGAGYVSTPPTYSDAACTAGQYASSTSPLRLYSCLGNKWVYIDSTGLVDWTNLTPVDTTPNAFTFGGTQTDAVLSTQYCSAAVTPAGYDAAATVVATGTATGLGWKVNGGLFVTSGTLSPGQTISACGTSSSSNSTSTTASVTVGGVAATAPFAMTTVAASGTACTGTIGQTGATTSSVPATQVYSATRFALGCGGSPATINATVGAGEFILSVYADDGTGAAPTTLLWSSTQFNETNSASHTISANITGLTLTEATYVWLSINPSGGSTFYRANTGTGTGLYKNGTSNVDTAPTPENPWDTAEDTTYANERGVWLTF